MTAKTETRATGGVSLTGDPMVIAANLMTLHIRVPSAVREMIAVLSATGAPGPTAGQKAAAKANNLCR
jgi:hypothetical protein